MIPTISRRTEAGRGRQAAEPQCTWSSSWAVIQCRCRAGSAGWGGRERTGSNGGERANREEQADQDDEHAERQPKCRLQQYPRVNLLHQEEEKGDGSHACDERGEEHDGEADSDGRCRHLQYVLLLLGPGLECREVGCSNHEHGQEIREHEQHEKPVVELGRRGEAVSRPLERCRLVRPGHGDHGGGRGRRPRANFFLARAPTLANFL